jgi:hypothetical protein
MLIHWALLVILPITTDSSDCWTSSFAVPRPYDVMTPLCHLFLQPRSRHRDLTGGPLSSSVLYTQDTPAGLDDRCSPLRPLKGSPLPKTTDTKPCINPSSTAPSLLFSLQLVLATLPLNHPSHQFCSAPSKLFLCLRPRCREEAGK